MWTSATRDDWHIEAKTNGRRYANDNVFRLYSLKKIFAAPVSRNGHQLKLYFLMFSKYMHLKQTVHVINNHSYYSQDQQTRWVVGLCDSYMQCMCEMCSLTVKKCVISPWYSVTFQSVPARDDWHIEAKTNGRRVANDNSKHIFVNDNCFISIQT